MLDSAGEVQSDILVMFLMGVLHINTEVLADQQKVALVSFMWVVDAVLSTYQK